MDCHKNIPCLSKIVNICAFLIHLNRTISDLKMYLNVLIDVYSEWKP